MEAWGFSLGIDIKGCNPNTIRSRELIQEYVIKLCKMLELERFGDCQISALETGFTMVQLFTTGATITATFCNDSNAAYVDILSTRDYNQSTATTFTMDFFGSEEASTHFAVRY